MTPGDTETGGASEAANAHFLRAKSHFGAGRLLEAEVELKAAILLEPDSARYLGALGTLLMRRGQFGEANENLRKALTLDPRRAGTYFDLVYSGKFSAKDCSLIADMEALGVNEPLKMEDRKFLQYALGKAHDDLGNFAQAIRHFDSANEIAKALSFGGRKFQPEEFAATFDSVRRTQTREFIDLSVSSGNASELPILIVGMMRSGTTLVEQILSSHPECGGAGELFFWMKNRRAFFNPANGRFRPEVVPQLTESYLSVLRNACPGKARVTDKMPQNFMELGLMHAAFPNARIIHCRRNPLDTCLSIYFTPLTNPAEFYHDKANIAFAYEQYLALMQHWRETLPTDRFMEISYEDIVQDREKSARRLIEFCGLPWDERVLAHESSARDVLTASLWQVRQPVYSSSVGRWKHYQAWIAEFSRLLP